MMQSAANLVQEVTGMSEAEWQHKMAARRARFAALLAEADDVVAVDYGWEGVLVAEHVLAA